MKLGIVFGTFAPMHQGHLENILRAKKECDRVVVITSGREGDRGYPLLTIERRYELVSKEFSGDELVDVICFNETKYGVPDYPEGWPLYLKYALELIAQKGFGQEDFVFYVGDSEYYSYITTQTSFGCVLLDREKNPISASVIRENPIKHWRKIVPSFRPEYTTKILIAGTASEGKTTLCRDLGMYFDAPYGYEYAREYMLDRRLMEENLMIEDYFSFLTGQYHVNMDMLTSHQNKGVIFADTDAIVTKMYAYKYLQDNAFKIDEDDYNPFATAADLFAKKIQWDKIFLLPPTQGFIDDGYRYMGHSDLVLRSGMYISLCNMYDDIGLYNKTEQLGILGGTRSYVDDFNRIVQYVNQEVYGHV